MKTEIFTFDLPAELIANEPANPRDSSKLLHLNPNGEITHHQTRDLDRILQKGDLLVFNDTKVIPARLYGLRNMAHFEITLFKQINLSCWEALIKNSRRLKINDLITFDCNLTAAVVEKKIEGPVILSFNKLGESV